MDDQFKGGSFSDVPVFEGGPVENEKLIVAAWEWLESPNSFKLYFGNFFKPLTRIQHSGGGI